jgi:ubiquinone/menaquinone biosynthesis C-methylase UbiE
MPVWIVPVIIIVLGLLVLSFLRLRVPRDTEREKFNDHDSFVAYDQVSRWPLFGLVRYVFLRQLRRYHPEGTLVDVGCGPGYLALAIARKFPRLNVLGIDISPEMVALAQHNLAALELDSRVKFQSADVEQLPLEAGSIGFVVSTLSLHHWSNPGQALEEIYRVLKPGGQLLIFDLRRDTPLLAYCIFQLGQRFFAPLDIRRTNGAIGSIWSSYTAAETQELLSLSSFSAWKVQKGWGWAYLWGKK